MVLRRALPATLLAAILPAVTAAADQAPAAGAPAAADAGVPPPGTRPLPLGCPIVVPPALEPLPADADPESVYVTAGGAEFQLGRGGSFDDELLIRQGDRTVRADGATYDAASGEFRVSGNVEFRDAATRVRGASAEYAPASERLRITEADFELYTLPARGGASTVAVQGTQQLRLAGVQYTSCAAGEEDWLLRAREIRIDREAGLATARGARLDFKGVPILWSPWLAYPITGQRTTGLLLPDFGTSGQRGFELWVPYYFNIAPNYDATLTPRWMSDRGLQLQGEFRYLTARNRGELDAEFLPSDRQEGDNRALVKIDHVSRLPGHWQLDIEATDVTDNRYFEDLVNGVANTSQIALERRMDLQYFDGPWTVLLRVQDFETLDEEGITPEERPYRRLPQVAARGYWPEAPLGLEASIDGELTWFDRNTGVTGLRGHVLPRLALPLEWQGITLRPAVGADFTGYSLDDTAAGANDTPSRALPIYTVDLSTVLERRSGTGRRYLQTLEPRLQFVKIPFEDQQDLPLFDTINPDFNVVQLFRANRFVGLDRLGDTNQLNIGLTTRLIRARNGSQFLTATIGQIRYFDDRQVVLTTEESSSSGQSDWIGELGLNINDQWNLDLGYQWDSDANETQLAEVRVLYHPDDVRIVNLGYRLRGDNVEQLEVAAAWPIAKRWSAVGSYSYSLADQEPLESFVGVEYSNCCWGLRFTTRRNVVARTGESDTSFSLQLLLKGLGSGGSSARSLLGRDILQSNRFDRY